MSSVNEPINEESGDSKQQKDFGECPFNGFSEDDLMQSREKLQSWLKTADLLKKLAKKKRTPTKARKRHRFTPKRKWVYSPPKERGRKRTKVHDSSHSSSGNNWDEAKALSKTFSSPHDLLFSQELVLKNVEECLNLKRIDEMAKQHFAKYQSMQNEWNRLEERKLEILKRLSECKNPNRLDAKKLFAWVFECKE